MAERIQMFDVVALTESLPANELPKGQVGTVVEDLGAGVYEVEFADGQGRCYTTAPVGSAQLLVLHYEPAANGSD